jgi:hypothetical protein
MNVRRQEAVGTWTGKMTTTKIVRGGGGGRMQRRR